MVGAEYGIEVAATDGAQGIGIRHQGQCLGRQKVHHPGIGNGIGPQARADGQGLLVSQQIIQHWSHQLGDGSGGRFRQGACNRFGKNHPGGRLKARRDGHRHQADSRAKGAQARQMSRAAEIPRTGHHQQTPALILVDRSGARRQKSQIIFTPQPAQIARVPPADFLGKADVRHLDVAGKVPARSEQQAQLW